jgi:hypothetical protein
VVHYIHSIPVVNQLARQYLIKNKSKIVKKNLQNVKK